MVRAFVLFAVLTIAATAPLQDDANNKLRKNIDINSFFMKQSEDNEIPEDSPIKNVNKQIGYKREDNLKLNDIAYNNDVNVERNDEKFVKKDYQEVNSENVDYNFIDVDQHHKPESELSAFITLLEEFMKSIAEQLIKMYKQ